MLRISSVLMLLLGCLPLASAEDRYPAYRQVAASPGAFRGTQRFTMRFEGLKPVDAAFAPLRRNSSTHVMIVEEAGAKRVPMFVSLRSSQLVRKLRTLPTGVTYLIEGRMKFFKTPVYTAESFKNINAPSIKIEQKQSRGLRGYMRGGGSGKVSLDTSEATGPEAAGHQVHHILDIKQVRKLKVSERPSSSTADRTRAAAGYRRVEPADLSKLSGSGIPVRFNVPYMGAIGALSRQSQLTTLAGSFRGPEVSCVKAGDVDVPKDAGASLSVLKPPGPLSKVIVICYGSDWDIAATLETLSDGDTMELSGTLQAAPKGVDAKFVLMLEGLKKAAASAGPRPGAGSGTRPGPGPGRGPGPGPGRGPGGR